jgi:hypothetical protein
MATAKDVADAMLNHPDPVVTAKDLADVLDCSTQHVRDRMDALLLADVAGTKEAGARARVYWHAERVCRPHVAPEDHPDQSDLRDLDADDDAPAPRETRDVECPPEPEVMDDVDDLADDLDALDLRGSGEVRLEREAAVRACYDLVKERGTAQKADFVSEVRPDHPAGYDSARSWYDYVVLNGGLRGLVYRRDDLRAPPEGGRTWRFVGE